jgi:membrane protein YdbS with pleckstrin-like domain
MISLQANEHILFMHRRHWFPLFLVLFRIFLGVVVVIVAPILIRIFIPELFIQYSQFIYFMMLLAIQALWTFLFLGITDYYLDVWIITDARLILVELNGLFHRTVTSIDYVNIQDVSTRIVGLIPTFFHYGDVTIQSAGTFGEFTFKEIAHPNDVREKILKVRNEYLSTHEHHPAEQSLRST